MSFLTLFLLFICVINANIQVLNGDDFSYLLASVVDTAQIFTYNDPDMTSNYSGVLSWYLPGDGDCSGKILFVGDDSYTHADVPGIMGCGAEVVVIATSLRTPGIIGANVKNVAVRDNIRVPAFQVSLANEGWDQLLEDISKGVVVEILITAGGNENEWEDVQINGLFWHVTQFVVFGLTVVVFVVASEKFIFSLFTKKKGITTGQIILFIEMLVGAFRAIFIGIDPANLRGIFPFPFMVYSLQVTAPLSLLTNQLLILYWFEALSEKGSFLERFKYIIFAVLGLFFILGSIVGPIILITVPWTLTMVYILFFFYTILALCLSIYIFAKTPRMYQLIKSMKESGNINYHRQARLIVSSAICLCIWCLSTIGIILGLDYPTTWYTAFFIWIILLNIISLLQVLVFQPEISYFERSQKSISLSKKTTTQ